MWVDNCLLVSLFVTEIAISIHDPLELLMGNSQLNSLSASAEKFLTATSETV